MGPKLVPKRVPKRVLRGPYDLGRSWGALGICVHGFFVLLDRFGCHFGGQWDPEGVPKSSFGGANRHKRLQNGVPEGGREKGSKIERKQGPKMNDFWEATSKIVLPCRRRAYFA